MSNLRDRALGYSSGVKLSVDVKSRMETKEDLSLAYTPGIAEVSKAIVEDEGVLLTHTFVRNNLAVISNGTAVLGLGNIGHKGSYPVMEGKSMLFKWFGNVDAVPIIVKTKNVDEFVEVVEQIADSFGAINLEDIAAPDCFEIEERLKKSLKIPVMHDDQHGTAVVVLAAVLGALELFPHREKQTKIVVSGVGAAGVAIIKILVSQGFENVIAVDSRGAIYDGRDALEGKKLELAKLTNPEREQGSLEEVLKGAGVFVGVSRAGLVTAEMVGSMEKDAVVIAMANPDPEILPDVARSAGAAIVATGRSDFANQVNNALAFPSIFRAAIDLRRQIDSELLLAAARLIMEYQKEKLDAEHLLPDILNEAVHRFVAEGLVKEFGG